MGKGGIVGGIGAAMEVGSGGVEWRKRKRCCLAVRCGGDRVVGLDRSTGSIQIGPHREIAAAAVPHFLEFLCGVRIGAVVGMRSNGTDEMEVIRSRSCCCCSVIGGVGGMIQPSGG